MILIQDIFQIGMARHIPDIVPFPDIKGHILNLAPANKPIKETVGVGRPECDFDKDPLPFLSDSIRGIYAFHVLEHLHNPLYLLSEMQRVLVPGGSVLIVVPYYNSQMMAHDLDHKHVFCEDTWKQIFNNPYYDDKAKGYDWKFKIGLNIIIGIVERNLCLMTQLVKLA